MTRLVIVSVVLLGTLACGGASTPAEAPPSAEAAVTAPPVDVAKVAAVARRIKADPGAAEQALREAGFDRASFEAALFAVAADPELSAQYLRQSR